VFETTDTVTDNRQGLSIQQIADGVPPFLFDPSIINFIEEMIVR
jgi:hypothetical protein